MAIPENCVTSDSSDFVDVSLLTVTPNSNNNKNNINNRPYFFTKLIFLFVDV